MGNDISYFGALSILYAKNSAGNIKSICLKDSHTNYSNNVGISMWYFESPYDDTPEMILLALWTSFLKDSHTHFQINVGIDITDFEDFTWLHAKNDNISTMN